MEATYASQHTTFLVGILAPGKHARCTRTTLDTPRDLREPHDAQEMLQPKRIPGTLIVRSGCAPETYWPS